MQDSNTPIIGMIVPPAPRRVPADGGRLYPGLPFIATGLGRGSVTPEGYDAVIESVVDHACRLKEEGAAVISLMGTSLSFYRGAAFNRALTAAMHDATGLPCTTMSTAVLNGLRALDVARVALATAYIDDVNDRLAAFLAEEGLVPAGCRSLGITGVDAMGRVDTDTLVDLCVRAIEAAPDSDAILLSCGGLQTLDAIPEVERRLGVPVVSSSPAGFWDAVRLAGSGAKAATGYGRLLGA
ncbi:arylmalonate decarboxylase [Achromobacter denitrificans]|uniref:arylmalonate decarboxylase n=1 Tax=Achromobacter denitrificans TaxID=32002 RepID=UPI000F65A239|nr:arylmalonate decarboxylase [Achromobacter denitrificans]RSE86897.1 arylmalonate decarboxylase [Achromobacter denitrificans]